MAERWLRQGVNKVVAETSDLVAAVTNEAITVHKILLLAAGGVTVNFLDGATALNGYPMSLIVGVPLVIEGAQPDCVLFQTTGGNALRITLGGAVQVSGIVWYTIGPSTRAATNI